LPATHFAAINPDHAPHVKLERKLPARKETVGVDVFVDWRGQTPEDLAVQLQRCNLEHLKLTMITNRGVKVWPGGFPETFRTDHWRGRFSVPEGLAISHEDIVQLLGRVSLEGLDFIKTENLCTFDGEPGFSLGQGQ
jgi:isocitrate dehydrogenase